MKSKKIIVAIIVILIILLMAGVAFAYVYTATDILKSDKELFFKYFGEIAAEDGFLDKRLDEFREKKKQNPYENSGTITTEVQYPDAEMNDIIEKVNELAITFSGKVDSVNQKVEQNIEVDYGNNVVFPINYRQDGNSIGLQPSKIIKKYIAVRNENLEELAENVNGDSLASIPNKIYGIIETVEAPSDIIQGLEFSEDEKNQLKQIYGTIIEQNLLEEKFSSIKTKQSESYTLEISFEEIKNIIIKMLEASKENTLIMDKLNEAALKMDSTIEPMDATDIDEIIESFNEEDVSEISNLKITLVQNNKQLSQLIIENEEAKIAIDKKITENDISYNISYEMKETEEENTETDSILSIDNSSSTQVNAYFEVKYSGLDDLNSIQENYEFGFEVGADQEIMKYDYEIDTNTVFTSDISIEALDETTAIFLNDYDETQVTEFLNQLVTRLADTNKNQMAELGLKEDENPLLYSNPITMLGVMIYNMASESVDNVDLSSQEISAFNDKFTQYVGEERRGSEVNALIKTVQNSSLSSAGSAAHFVKVTLDGAEVSENVDYSKTYSIEAIYDTEGYIIEMKVTTNN